MKNVKTIDEYIAYYPKEVQEILNKFRKTIHDIAPNATESINYGVPTFKLNGKNLVHFASFPDHYSFFPTSSGVSHFQKELKNYKTSKGTIQFPVNKEIPWDLVKQITEFRVKEVMK
ncbi:MAG TPA: DUF1801 domain-containing protein [Patescibacteria group bacterium]|nr:DUF1801 domain-containing protein [Patescibacteria group bacterium]